MPLWTVFHDPSTFTTDAEKSALAASITDIYVQIGLPKFYVVVTFTPLPPSSFYVGALPRPSPFLPAANGPSADTSVPFVRITIQNIARKIDSPAKTASFLARVDAALKPHIEDKGYEWEYSVLETSRELWKMNGLVPPPTGSEGEEVWRRENRAVKLE